MSAPDADGQTAPWLVLIGPVAAGKSTLGEQLAAATGRRFADLDDVAEPYYAELGWTMARLRQRIDEAGLLTAEREWEPARVHAVERAVTGRSGMILALGAGHTHYTQTPLFERVRAALAPVTHVVLVLPSPDAERSVRVLRERSVTTRGTDWISDDHDFIRHWVTDPANRVLATEVFYTDGEDPGLSTWRLLARLLSASAASTATRQPPR